MQRRNAPYADPSVCYASFFLWLAAVGYAETATRTLQSKRQRRNVPGLYQVSMGALRCRFA